MKLQIGLQFKFGFVTIFHFPVLFPRTPFSIPRSPFPVPRSQFPIPRSLFPNFLYNHYILISFQYTLSK